MTFVAWPEIEGFHHIRKHVRAYPDLLKGTSKVSYKCKVKLHGTNAAVQVHLDGTVLAQSRSNIITPENDNAGFARWVQSQASQWRGVIPLAHMFGFRLESYIIYGEWCGPSIQKGVALSQIPKKVFAVFAARPLDGTDAMVTDPTELAAMVAGIPDVYVLPWYERTAEVDFNNSDEDLAKSIAPINDWVMDIEANDPWVEKTFGVKGTGEGLVFYPGGEHMGYENFTNLCFKAKGEAHKNIKTAKPVQINPEVAASVDAFVDLVLTPARLEQGATTVGGFDLKLTGKFVAWISSDIQKECQDEMNASNLDWKAVQNPLVTKARTWYLAESKK